MTQKRNKIRWEGVVKVQRPIATNGSMNDCLVYNEERSIQIQLPLDDEAMKSTFPNGELKTYWRATLRWSGGHLPARTGSRTVVVKLLMLGA